MFFNLFIGLTGVFLKNMALYWQDAEFHLLLVIAYIISFQKTPLPNFKSRTINIYACLFDLGQKCVEKAFIQEAPFSLSQDMYQ